MYEIILGQKALTLGLRNNNCTEKSIILMPDLDDDPIGINIPTTTKDEWKL